MSLPERKIGLVPSIASCRPFPSPPQPFVPEQNGLCMAFPLVISPSSHTVYGRMKMTMHINAALLARVMKDYEFPSKTEAVEAALLEMDRQMRLREFRKNGLGLTSEELTDSVYPDYDPDALRGAGHARTPADWILEDALAEEATPYSPASPRPTPPAHG